METKGVGNKFEHRINGWGNALRSEYFKILLATKILLNNVSVEFKGCGPIKRRY